MEGFLECDTVLRTYFFSLNTEIYFHKFFISMLTFCCCSPCMLILSLDNTHYTHIVRVKKRKILEKIRTNIEEKQL